MVITLIESHAPVERTGESQTRARECSDRERKLGKASPGRESWAPHIVFGSWSLSAEIWNWGKNRSYHFSNNLHCSFMSIRRCWKWNFNELRESSRIVVGLRQSGFNIGCKWLTRLRTKRIRRKGYRLRSSFSRLVRQWVKFLFFEFVALSFWMCLWYFFSTRFSLWSVALTRFSFVNTQCEKLRKKRSSLVGAFVSTHGKSIDEVDKSIVEARTSLNEVTVELQERVHRWKQIELLCGFNIINNNGLNYLETILYRGAPNGRSFALRGNFFRPLVRQHSRNKLVTEFLLSGRMSSQDDLDDDASSVYTPSTSGGGGGGGGGGAAGKPESEPREQSEWHSTFIDSPGIRKPGSSSLSLRHVKIFLSSSTYSLGFRIEYRLERPLNLRINESSESNICLESSKSWSEFNSYDFAAMEPKKREGEREEKRKQSLCSLSGFPTFFCLTLRSLNCLPGAL